VINLYEVVIYVLAACNRIEVRVAQLWGGVIGGAISLIVFADRRKHVRAYRVVALADNV